MISTVVVTLGRLAECLTDSAQRIIGHSNGLHHFSIDWGLGMDEIKHRLGELVSQVDQGDGVLVLTDMQGSSATNVANAFRVKDQVEVVTGVNLPMVVKVLNLPKVIPLSDAVNMLQEQSRKAINSTARL